MTAVRTYFPPSAFKPWPASLSLLDKLVISAKSNIRPAGIDEISVKFSIKDDKRLVGGCVLPAGQSGG